MTELDIRLDDEDLAELCALAPRDPSRVAPSWEQARPATLSHAIHPGHPTLRRAGTLAAAAAVLVAVGTGLALATPRGLGQLTPAQAACSGGHELSSTGTSAGGTGVLTARRSAGQVLVASPALATAGAQVQLLDAHGRPLTRAVPGARAARLGLDDLCPGRRPQELAAAGVVARLVYAADDGQSRRCVQAPVGVERVETC